jgi:4'-phosphopantetheinyl transferase
MDVESTIKYMGPFSGTNVPVLNSGEIHIWHTFYHDSASLIKLCSNALSSAELEHKSYFKFPKDQHSFVVSHGLLRILLSYYLHISPDELKMVKHSKGKPYQLNDPCLFFNISNSGDCCVFAVSRNGEVGVDLEKIRPLDDLDELIRKNFSPKEQAVINRQPKERLHRFFKFWTIKEAFLKAIGEGMRLTPDLLEFSSEKGEHKLQSFAGIVESQEWLFSDYSPNTDYAGTLAHVKSSGEIKTFKF